MIAAMSNHSLNRRDLFRSAAGVAALSASSYAQVAGANDRIRLGVIGCGTRGMNVMEVFQGNANVQVAAVCDIYGVPLDQAQQKAPGARGYTDHRKLIEQQDLNAVLIATPDHWHMQQTIDAANAGKDIYVEKPLTLKIEEGPEIVKAVRINERVCQVGMQQRSGKHYLRAKQEYFDSKKLGKITLARTWWHGNSFHLRQHPPALDTRPSNLDWARYLGPIKWRDYDPQQYYNFRAYLDFGGGQITDLFTHWIDVVHMFMEQDNPTAAVASGGVYNYKDGRTAPDTICVLLEYPNDWTATFEATLAPGKRGAAVEMVGTAGSLYIDRGEYRYLSAEQGARPVVVKAESDLVEDHVTNFLECMRTRQRPHGDVWIGHRSAQASHLGNIAYLEKRRIKFDPFREEILPL